MRRTTATICLLMLMCVLLAGCSALNPAFPSGAFVAHSADQNIVLDFEKSGAYTAVLGGEQAVTASSYRQQGNTVTFAADPPCADEAVYAWVLEGEKLTFDAIEPDACPQRRELLQDKVFDCITCT